MEEIVVERTSEFSNVIASVVSEFYTQYAPAPMAQRLARLHENAWDAILCGATAVPAFTELHRQAARLANADDLIDCCNQHVVWALTPVIAASLACGPGEDRVSLRTVGDAMMRLLESALADVCETSQVTHQSDLRAAA
jgi:hypothetical protein